MGKPAWSAAVVVAGSPRSEALQTGREPLDQNHAAELAYSKWNLLTQGGNMRRRSRLARANARQLAAR